MIKFIGSARNFCWVLCVLLLVSCGSPKEGELLHIINPAAQKQRDGLVVLKRSLVEQKLGKLDQGSYFTLYKEADEPITIQFDDLDQDGRWDEAVFLYSLPAHDSVALSIEKTLKTPEYKNQPLAHVRMKVKDEKDHFGPNVDKLEMPHQNPPTDFSKHALPPYLTEGPGWENDKVAFRLYFDTRNNKDIYGKRVNGMVLDTVGANPANSYHHYADWGMDILQVGNSLGAGALAFHYQRPGGTDTLVRLGGAHIKAETYQKIADGPIRAVFQMTYKWTLEGKDVTVKEQISIWGGQYFYESRVIATGHLPKGLRVDMGMANFKENKMDSLASKTAKVLFSYGKQSENQDNLGLAILSPVGRTVQLWQLGSGTTPTSDVQDSYLSEQQIKADQPAVFRFYAGWSKSDSRFEDAASFRGYLKSQAELYQHAFTIN